jgi:LPXTG-site transpeptidase (sortase) family protein
MKRLSVPQRKSLKVSNLHLRKRSFRSKFIVVILTIIAISSFVLLVLPYLPRLQFLLFKPKIDGTSYRQAARQSKEGKSVHIAAGTQQSLKGNRLVLPGIGVNSEIIDGKNINVIGKNQGVWRETPSLDPTVDGNIVIAGHRFLYTAKNGGYFYNLPELKIDDKIYIRWKDKVFEYQVYNSKTVLPTQIDIRDKDPKIQKKLTLYTCYPLGSTAKRFVIEAKQL